MVANPWRRRTLSRYAASEAIAAAIAFIASLVVPFGPLLLLIAWLVGPAAAAAIAAAWLASGLFVLLPGISEGVVGWLIGSREPTIGELARLTRAWDEVCRSTGIAPHRFALRVLPCPPPSPEIPWYVNACSAGTNVVGVTADALVLLDRDELRAVLSHELAHHAGYDAAPRGLVVWYLALPEAIAGGLARVVLRFAHAPIRVILGLTSRPCEFAADAFAARLGHGRHLRRLLLRLGPNEPPTLTGAILASHPATVDRVRRLDAYEA